MGHMEKRDRDRGRRGGHGGQDRDRRGRDDGGSGRDHFRRPSNGHASRPQGDLAAQWKTLGLVTLRDGDKVAAVEVSQNQTSNTRFSYCVGFLSRDEGFRSMRHIHHQNLDDFLDLLELAGDAVGVYQENGGDFDAAVSSAKSSVDFGRK